ncbi:MAG TPA: co-chaperone GroES [Flavobacteriales bacterium]|nr:co-chaperone GroES [Flavobacteriales bacterium]HIB77198.1 co-chaperone GroES [Flavobacteriales bacterium]
MKPIGKYIAIEPINEKLKTSSGLMLSSDDVKDFRYKKGTVIKPGTEVTQIKEGDTIFYDKGAGHTMMIDERVVTLIREPDVVVVV